MCGGSQWMSAQKTAGHGRYHGFISSDFSVYDIRLQTLPASILFVKRLNARLGSEIQHGGRVFLGQLEEPAADALFLIRRKYEQFCNGSEKIAV